MKISQRILGASTFYSPSANLVTAFSAHHPLISVDSCPKALKLRGSVHIISNSQLKTRYSTQNPLTNSNKLGFCGKFDNPSKKRSFVTMADSVPKTEEEWRAVLSPEQFRILRMKGTEPGAFSFPLHLVAQPPICSHAMSGMPPSLDAIDEFPRLRSKASAGLGVEGNCSELVSGVSGLDVAGPRLFAAIEMNGSVPPIVEKAPPVADSGPGLCADAVLGDSSNANSTSGFLSSSASI